MSTFSKLFARVRLLCAIAAAISAGEAALCQVQGPQPGDVYKEFSRIIPTDRNLWRVNDPNSSFFQPGGPNPSEFLPNPQVPITIDDLQGAVRAELLLDEWGGHVGTSNKRVRFNGHAYITIPEISTTPTPGQCYLNQVNAVINLPLSDLVQGTNIVEGTSGDQTCQGFGWGQWGMYGMIIRIYYSSSRPHPTGSITSPTSGSAFPENPTVTASVSAGVNRVDFLAYYDGYDADGDGVYTDWQQEYHRLANEQAMAIHGHVGTATSTPFQVSWNTTLVPDQNAGAVKLIARIRDGNGVWFVTNPVANLTLQRTNASVKLYKPFNVPERLWVRAGETKTCNVTIPAGDNPANAVSATMLLKTWNGVDGAAAPNQPHYMKFNNFTLPQVGENHYYRYDQITVPPSALLTGLNTYTFNSNSSMHGIEIDWPGPGLLVRYNAVAGPPVLTEQPVSQVLIQGPSVSFHVSASGIGAFSYQWQKNGVDIAGATGQGYTTPPTALTDDGAVYRCKVTNPYGITPSNEATLRVRPAGFQFVSDDFSSGLIRPDIWNVVNPVGDAAITVTGGGTSNARLSLALISGLGHDVWVVGNLAPRIMQPTSNSDFEAEAKFETPLTTGNQFQGIVVEQDPANYIRFDLVTDGSSTRVFAATFVGGSPTPRVFETIAPTGTAPLWLRVGRQGDQWTESYSTDGTSFTTGVSFSHAMTVGSIGVFAGNAGAPPPNLISLVDYFFNTSSPISPEDGGGGSGVGPAIATQPANQTVTAGQTASFTVTASGTAPLTYQWQKNAVNIAGATSASYTTPATALPDSGSAYRCVVTNGLGQATSNAATLTVSPVPPQGAGIVSDDFSPASLNTSLWTVTNPLNDATVGAVGTGTANARLSIGIPAGTAHDVWSSGNFGPRILQAAPNGDFEVEAKFEAPLTTAFQFQGILVQQDAGNYLRFDFVGDGAQTKVFAATFVNGSPSVQVFNAIGGAGIVPLWLRVKRQGNVWTESYSANGTSFTQAVQFTQVLTVSSAGVFAGTGGSGPAFTSLTDYFFNTASPIAPEDGGGGSSVGPAIATQPANQTVTAGQTASFTVTASGTAPLTYQWQKNAVNIAGATSASYTTPATALADSGSAYRSVVTNGLGQATSNAATLTVNPAPPQGAGIVSDDFSAPSLNTSLWTVTNPLNDATVGVVGTGTANARLSIGIPAGTAHDVWSSGNFGPRILQAAPNGDFEVEAKFEAPLTTAFQFQGILVQQDAGNYLRFDFVGDGAQTKVFAATFVNGSPSVQVFNAIGGAGIVPLWLRVKRQGNVWTESYSANGTSFTQAVQFTQVLTVGSAGVFAGTGGSGPAFTSLTDYFFNTASPVAPEDGGGGSGAGPAIATQPANQTVTAGQTASFTVTASGTAPLTYQWQKNAVNISGATSASYTTPATALADSGSAYRCVVTNGLGQATSNAAALTVTPAPPQGAGIVSDDFRAASLNTSLWTVTNPLNDATVGVVGTGTANARLSIGIPAGTAHDVWSSGNFGPRILQPAPNGDFEVEAKFEAPLTTAFQFQGILVQQDAGNYIRFDFVGDGAQTKVFAATFMNGSPSVRVFNAIGGAGIAPLWLRVKRQGNVWTESYSANGTSFTQAVQFTQVLTVGSAGVFAGTGGSGPAFTSLTDYFFNTASPVAPEDGGGGSGAGPAIATQPANQTVTAGQTASFTVTASGTAPLTYQWQKNAVNIAGATSASYTTPATALADSGSAYRCVVTNGFGQATSSAAALTVTPAPPGPSGWWNAGWRYRVPVDVSAASVARSNKPVNVSLNFTQLLTALGASGTFNESSLRVIEVDGTGAILDAAVPLQFDEDAAFNAASNAAGVLIFLMPGTTAAAATRHFHVYFDTGGSSAPAVVPAQVSVTDNIDHEGQTSFKIVTSGATYYYHKLGAGFASIEDPDGIDWLNYHPGGGSAGEYRGVPNMGDVGHPGYTNATSTLVHQGPLKATIQSQSTNGLWRFMWEIYPRYATLTVQQAGGPYWLLYEGTPGGALNPATDFWTRSSGQTLTDDQQFGADIPGPEWVYFGDASMNRVLFLAHHEDDTLMDSFWQLNSDMTVFGFGRELPCCTRYLTAAPQHLTIGFSETQAAAAGMIDGSYRDLGVATGAPQALSGGGSGSSTVVSDQFNAPALNTSLWTFVNPLGDASVAMTGTQASIVLPAGTAHDAWTGGNSAPRIMQASNNVDFQVQAKFDTPMAAEFQFEGILVQQDASNYLRFDFVKDSSRTRVFAASVVGGVATVRRDLTITAGNPLALRVTRQGNQWTEEYSYDGVSFTTAASFGHSLTVSAIGPFAGNAGASPPAFTAKVDYFINTAATLTAQAPAPGPPVVATQHGADLSASSEPGSPVILASQPLPATLASLGRSASLDQAEHASRQVARKPPRSTHGEAEKPGRPSP